MGRPESGAFITYLPTDTKKSAIGIFPMAFLFLACCAFFFQPCPLRFHLCDLCRPFLHIAGGVRISVQRERGLSMAKNARQSLYIYARDHRMSGEGMPEITKSNGCLWDFTAVSQFIRLMRLIIGFLFVGPRFRYCFLSPTPRDVNLASRYRVRRQLRPLGFPPKLRNMPVIQTGCFRNASEAPSFLLI